jgi:hypothetical protein
METMKNKNLSASFVHEARLRIFKPSRRPSARLQTEIIETAAGKIKIEHRGIQDPADPKKIIIRPIGLPHADLLDAARQTALDRAVDGAGRLVLLIDPARVRRAAGTQASLNDTQEMMTDLVSALITIYEPTHLQTTGHIIDTWKKAAGEDGRMLTLPCPLSKTRRHADRAERHLWQITVGDVGMQLLNHDLPVTYPLADILSLRYGVSQAAARWLLGQSKNRQPQGGWMLDTVINSVSGAIGGTNLRHRRREIIQDAAGLSKLGIRVEGGRAFLSQSVHPTPESVHPTPESVHPTPESVHPTPESVHPTPEKTGV